MRTTAAAVQAVTSAEPDTSHSSSQDFRNNGGEETGSSQHSTLSDNPFAGSADVFQQYKKAFAQKDGATDAIPSNKNSSGELSKAAEELAQQLDTLVAQSVKQPSDANGSGSVASADNATADLQLQTARKLRQLLPTNKELLYLAQERNWVPLFLGWLNLHDRPAVQVEALLALTNIAELSAQQSYYQGSNSTSAASVTAAAAAAAVKAAGSKLPDSQFYFPSDSGKSSKSSSSSYSYPPSLAAPASGSVPFPPLSFSQTMTPEAVAAFDAGLSSSTNQTKVPQSKVKFGPAPVPAPSPFSSALSSTLFASALGAATGGSSSLGSNPMIPPPTPVASAVGGESSSFPQQLSASSQHLLLRHADAIPTLVSLLSSPNREVYEQAMWILGSIASSDSASSPSSSSSSVDGGRDKPVAARDVILAAGVMKELLTCLSVHPDNLSLQRMGSWTLSNLVEGVFQQSPGKGSKSSDYMSSDEVDMNAMLPVLWRLLNMADAEVLSYTCWTLSHLCDGPSSHISAIVNSSKKRGVCGGLVPRLVELLLHPSWRVTKPALRTIGNIVCAECSDDGHGSSAPTDYTEIILECGAVPRLKELITHSNREIQKEACWTLSNIAAGTVDQIQAVIDSGAIPPLVKLVGNKNTEQEVRSEACWVVLNATSCGNDSQISTLVDEGCVSVLGILLGETSMVMMALEGLERVLQVEEAREEDRRERVHGEKDDTPTPTLVSASLIQKALDKHNSSAVTKRATRIWKHHFVSCALCKESFSKHRTADATFCDECKCYVCSKCDCTVYHLSYQEELWAATEEKTEAKKNAKKSKNKKKKAKQKKAKQRPLVPTDETPLPNKEGSTGRSLMSSDGSESAAASPQDKSAPANEKEMSTSGNVKKATAANSDDRSDDEEDEGDVVPEGPEQDGGPQQPPIDFVLYLQQTGSIIALAKLMDALDYGDGTEYNDEDFDDAELKLLRHHKLMNQQATT